MIPLGAGNRAIVDAAIQSSHSVHVKVYITDLVGNPKEDVTDMFLGGQVDIDVEADVSRTCMVTLFDPFSHVTFDSNDPARGAIYMDNMLRVEYGVKTPYMTKFVYVPVFTGPIVSLTRDNDQIEVTAYGKEHLAMGIMWKNFNARKGANKVDTIKRLMREHAGETSFLLPNAPKANLSANLSLVALKQNVWEAANKVARSMDRALYYDGAGRLRMRDTSGNRVFTFEGGDTGTLLTIPRITFTVEEAVNAVIVKGRKKLKPKTKDGPDRIHIYSAKAVVDRDHPLSPWSIGRKVDGEVVPRFLVEVIENDKINSDEKAAAMAEKRLQQLLEQNVEVAFDAAPVPYLEEFDRVGLSFENYQVGFNLRQFSIPLTIGDAMTVGYNRPLLTVSRRRMNTSKHSKTKVVKKGKGKNGKGKNGKGNNEKGK